MEKFFYVFICNKGLAPFLKDEIKVKHPNFRLSFSGENFLSFVSDETAEVKDLQYFYARNVFIGLGKQPEGTIAQFTIDLETETETINPEGQTSLGFLKTVKGPGLWVRNFHQKRKQSFGRFYSLEEIFKPPSRAYYKIKEATELVNFTVDNTMNILEFGCAPGGATTYLLNQGAVVFGIDPAEMEVEHSRFTHFKTGAQDLRLEDLPTENIHMLVGDLNLDLDISLKIYERWLKLLRRNVRCVFFTLKTSNTRYLESNMKLVEEFSRHFHQVYTTQLYSHHKEFIFIGFR